MTHRYNEMNPGDALYMAARKYPGGIDALAARMGMPAGVLYKKLGTKVDSHHVSYEEVSTIIDFLIEAGQRDMAELVINSFCWRHDHLAFELPQQFVSDEQLFDQVLAIVQQKGDLARSLNHAMKDGRICTQEYNQIERDIQTCILGLLKLRKKIHIKHVEGE